jgi:hypothetical protein
VKDQRVTSVFGGTNQRPYMEGVEQRLSAAQDGVASAASAAAEAAASVTALEAILAALALNYDYADTTNDFVTSSSSFSVVTENLTTTLTTTGGDVLVILAGGAIYNSSNTEETFVALAVDGGTNVVVTYYRRNASSSTYEDNTEVPLAGMYLFTGLAAGEHTFKVLFRTSSGGTAAINASGVRVSALALEMKL